MDALTRIAESLLERESLDAQQIDALARGESLPEVLPSSDGSAQPTTAAEKGAGGEEAKADNPHGLPQPGNQPA